MIASFIRSVAKSDTFGGVSDTLSGLRTRYELWQSGRDLAAIMATLDRLSDRRLAMIGMRRGELFDAVSDLMLRAEEQRALGREVVELLEAPEAAERTASEPRRAAKVSAAA